MRITKYIALGELTSMNFRGIKEHREKYQKAIDEVNNQLNLERINAIAAEEGTTPEIIISKLEADKDFRYGIHRKTK